MNGRVDCARADERLEELALGEVPEPERTALLAHAASCRSCRARLDATVQLTDELLLLAPQHEPPPGFESRVLDRWSSVPVADDRRGLRERQERRLLVAAAALLVLVGGLATGLLVRRDDATEVSIVRSGVIVTGDGTRAGAIELIGGEHPYALVTIDRPRGGPGEVVCELVGADGRIVEVGRWDAEDVRRHVWAVGVDRALLTAHRMRIVDEQGTVLAVAELR